MTNRRAFLAAAPAGLLGLPQFSKTALAQNDVGNSGFDNEIASFWANQMAVPPEHLGGEPVIMRGGPPASFDREPFLLYYDAKAHVLVPATDVKPNLKSGDAQVNLTVSRYRLNNEDQVTFSRYQAGGMYLDVQQQQSAGQQVLEMAFSTFSAIFPQGISKGGGKSSSKGSTSKSSSGGSSTGSSGAGSSGTSQPAAASTPTLQQASQSQSLALPGGSGKASFIVFAKDRKRTAFGTFVSAMATVSNAAQPSYLSLLSLPSIATPALAAVRALVANLQSHGGNHQWLLQGPPMDVAATEDAATNLQNSAKFNSGYVVAVPKAHLSKMKNFMSNVQIIDGFLVPTSVKTLDVYDWIQANPPDGSYLTLTTSVKSTKLNSCSLPGLPKV